MSTDKLDPVELVEFGRVEKPHGLKGELCIALFADSPLLLENVRRIYLRLPGKKPRPCQIEAWRVHQQRVLLLVDRCQGRDQAEFWRGAEVLVRKRDLPATDEDELQKEDLLGLPVYHLHGAQIGVLDDIRDMAGQEIWFIRDFAGREILLPAVEEFVVDIDLDAGRICVDPPDGLLALYQS